MGGGRAFLDVDNFAFELIACAEFHELSLLLIRSRCETVLRQNLLTFR
jgi:hypothetical protein